MRKTILPVLLITVFPIHGFGATSPNPLLVPSGGALLKTYPSSVDYSLQYVGSTDVQGNTSFVVNVLNKSGAQVGAGSAGCSAL